MRRLFLAIIFLILTAALSFGWVLPQGKNFYALNKEIKLKQAEFYSLQEYSGDLNKISNKFQDYQTQLAKIDSSLPGDQDFPLMFDYLLKVGASTGLVVSNISGKQGEEGSKKEVFGVSLTGSRKSFYKLLSLLENSSRVFELKTVSLNGKGGDQSSEYNIEMEVNLR